MKRLSLNQFPSLASLKDPENLRLVVEVDLPQIKSNIEECKKVLHTYSSLPDTIPEVIEDVIMAWTRAHEWKEEVVAQFRKQKLNFDQKQPAQEVNFKPWTTSGEVNVYEFFTKFEEWSAGTLSENQKAYRLYNNYLDSSITETYEELRSKKDDYQSMKSWMITKWGAVKPVADACFRNIKKLPQPKSSIDYHTQATYARSVYTKISDLIHLQVSKGHPVPKLQEHLHSNSFLMDLYNVLPHEVKEKFGRHLAKEDEEPSNKEGQRHLEAMLMELKLYYRAVETALCNAPPPQATGTKPKQSQAAHSTTFTKQGGQPSNGNNQPPKSQPQNSNQNSTPPPGPVQLTQSPIAFPMPPSGLPRWACPLLDYQDHTLQHARISLP
jgi:hypothetical protein